MLDTHFNESVSRELRRVDKLVTVLGGWINNIRKKGSFSDICSICSLFIPP